MGLENSSINSYDTDSENDVNPVRNFDGISRTNEVGLEISNGVKWERIKSIEYFGYEQVYDIEVEGTYNFVGNGIIAHNTYISATTTETLIEPSTTTEPATTEPATSTEEPATSTIQ